MEIIIIILCLFCIFYLFFEKRRSECQRETFKYLIHVNGIRGKSTVSRLIDAGVRAGGYKVFTKITGTSPRIIDTFNVEREINRKGKANIKEQIKTINWAYREGAEVLITECMAVKPEYQYICENKILHADINIITNVREDHLDEMGKSLDEIASSLANTIPTNGAIFTSDEKYFDFFKREAIKKNSKVFINREEKEEYWEIDFPSNVALALEVCKYIGIDEKKALEGMKNYHRDPGVLKVLLYKNRENKIYFINAMAANDPNSTEIIIDRLSKKDYWNNKRYLLVNNRGDRVSRWEQYISFVKKIDKKFDKILISGENRELFKKYLLKEKIAKEKIEIVGNASDFDSIEKDILILAVGNICGNGKKIVDYFEEMGEVVDG
ncbi:poly-gamma-glutamate synthase PgsB [uncultured Fusobacterium sp.]|jgi:poly-gamma-glutamate synthase PgsB/CapB|uniref:poly-gamma-glutamate synthase PgsB n=2 Tax=Fusobacterium TaxID=848 RepID=UPI0025EEC19B|nr:poly-gamma-glutamate synthase PgsB [uncultured Fusobacterium sp.]MCF2638987.1 poly-gamma-glutamate synthase PgsB [Fusobacterium varium]